MSLNSRYDRYAHGDPQALDEREIRGYNVFRGFVARCSQCHVPPLFASSNVAVVGAPPVPTKPYDLGAAELRNDRTLRGAFKVPTLRNVAHGTLLSGRTIRHAGRGRRLLQRPAGTRRPRGHGY